MITWTPAKDLEALIDNLKGMVFRCTYDSGLSIEYVSRGSAPLLGYEPDELMGKTAFRQLVNKADLQRNKEIYAGITPQDSRYQMVYRIKTAKGAERWVKEDGIAIYSGDGVLTAVEGIITDINDYKIVEHKLRLEYERLKNSINNRFGLGQIIGKSASMQAVYDNILKAASNRDAHIIISGESGAGKELAARAIHDLSDRNQNPFVPVNCGALSENLLESEFFGHLKGAFTGAFADKTGFLKLADGGTLFLDEIGEINTNMQVKLLRALDTKGYIPVGGNTVRFSDFRIIGATNQDLKRLVSKGRMRMDFFYRINVIPLQVPPLRERREDILLLIDHFLERHAHKGPVATLPPQLMMEMKNYDWPGNVRELKNAIDRYLTLGELSFIGTLQEKIPQPSPAAAGPLPDAPAKGLKGSLDEVERQMILQTLEKYQWKKGVTASKLRISARSLQRKLKKYEIN